MNLEEMSNDQLIELVKKQETALGEYVAIPLGEFKDAQPVQQPAPVAEPHYEAGRKQGRAEALAILLQLDPECGIDEYTGWRSSGAPEDEGSAYWEEDKLRKLFGADSALADMMDRAEAEYWKYLGMQDEAERAKNFAANMHSSGRVREVLANAGEFDLMADLCRAAPVPAASVQPDPDAAALEVAVREALDLKNRHQVRHINYLKKLVDAYGPKSLQYDIEHPTDGLNSADPAEVLRVRRGSSRPPADAAATQPDSGRDTAPGPVDALSQCAGEITTWGDRVPLCPTDMEIRNAMQAEIAELRAALASREAAAPQDDAAKLVEYLIRYKHCMSYNDSYFGEPAGELKRMVYAADRAHPAASVTQGEGQQDRIDAAVKNIAAAIQINDSDTMGKHRGDDTVIWTASGSWSGSADVTLGDLRAIAAQGQERSLAAAEGVATWKTKS